MKKILSVLLFLLFSKEIAAKDLGIHGAIFEIKEKNLLEEIKEKLQEAKKDGRLEKFQNNVQKQMFDQVNSPKSLSNIVKVTKNREWFFDPSVSLPNDLKDQNGRVFYHAGTKVNPLEKISLSKALLFIDGADEAQVNWALNENLQRNGKVKIILVRGKILDLMKTKKVRLYFDMNGVLIKKFSIRAYPALVEQKGKVLKIKEIAL